MKTAGKRGHLATGAALVLMTLAARAEPDAPGEVPALVAFPTVALLSVEVVGMAPLPGSGVDRNLLPYPVQTATAKTMRQSPGENLSEFMARNLTGVGVNEISGSPFQNDVTFRGFRASPVLGSSQGISVYLDGVRVNEPFGDVVNWDMLPESAIGSVLLAPGSNPLYGLNTLGGALALSSKSGKSHPGIEADVSTSSAGRRRTDLVYGYRDDNGRHALLATTLFDDSGWRAHSEGRLGNVYMKVGGSVTATDWSVSLLAGRSRLVGNGLLPSFRADTVGQRDGFYESDRRAAYTYADETRNRLHQILFGMLHRLDESSELTASAYLRNSRRDTVNGDSSEDYADYVRNCAAGFRTDGAAADAGQCAYTRAEALRAHSASLNTTSTRQNSRGLSVNWTTYLPTHHLLAGASFDGSSVSFSQFEQAAWFTPAREVRADAAEPRLATASVIGAARTLGVYAADTWRVGEHTHLTMAARYNHARVGNVLVNDGQAQAPESFTYRKLNPALGLTRDAGPGLTLLANLSQSNRIPTVIELGCANPQQPCRLPVGLQSDPYLKQVLSRTMEAGARWQPERGATASVSLYRTVNQDDILFRSAGATQQGYFSNFKQTRHAGMDLAANRQYGPFTARLSYSYLKAIYDADGVLYTGARHVQVGPGTRIAGLPRHTLKLALDWHATPALMLGADLMVVSDMSSLGNEDGLSADTRTGQAPFNADWRIRGHALVGLQASYRPAPGWELYARVNNAMDRRYESFGAVATDMFPNGSLLQPLDGVLQVSPARFVAPGAPRSIVAGLRYRF